jgi:hypothetical protein
MKKFRSYSSSYRPYGSDDGYDYEKDNRDGSVDDYVEYIREWKKNREKNTSKEEDSK